MLCHTSNHWGHRNCKQNCIKISGNNTRTTLNIFLTKIWHARNITYHKESATSWDLKPEWWGSPLAQEEKYQGRKKPVTRDNNNNNNNNNLWHYNPYFALCRPLYWGFCDHTQLYTPPVDEWSSRHRGLYLHRTTQHINTTDKHPCPQRDSNPRSQQQSGRRPTP
jgi:hypothetical protein